MHTIQRIFFGNYILSVAFVSWLAAQVCKTVINYIMSGKLDMERMYGAGGMPSAHSAFVCSTVIASAKLVGINSPIFAIAFILATIVMYDATGVRRAAGEQAKALNRISDWMSDDDENTLLDDGKKLKEKLGHTPFEVLGGALLGILIAVLIPVC